MGFKFMVFARMPINQAEDWTAQKRLEFMWQPKFLTGTK